MITPPYRSRIVLRSPSGDETELVRFDRAISNYDRRFWLRDIAPEWDVIEQTTTPARLPMPCLHVDQIA